MKKHVVGLVLLLGTLSVTRNASAETLGDPNKVEDLLIAVGFGTLDFGLVLADTAMGKSAPRGYGGFETVVAGGQFAICLDQAIANRAGGGWGGWALGAGAGAVLLLHGIVTLVGPSSHTEAPAPPPPVTVAPLALSDVARGSVPGLAVLGRF